MKKSFTTKLTGNEFKALAASLNRVCIELAEDAKSVPITQIHCINLGHILKKCLSNSVFNKAGKLTVKREWAISFWLVMLGHKTPSDFTNNLIKRLVDEFHEKTQI